MKNDPIDAMMREVDRLKERRKQANLELTKAVEAVDKEGIKRAHQKLDSIEWELNNL